MYKFVFRGDGLSGMINNTLTTHEREEIINRQELTDDSCFLCRIQGCPFSFKFDWKSRRKHELTHKPPPVIKEFTNLPITLEKPNTHTHTHKKNTKKAENSDGIFNYNCAILTHKTYWMLFPRVMARDSWDSTNYCCFIVKEMVSIARNMHWSAYISSF